MQCVCGAVRGMGRRELDLEVVDRRCCSVANRSGLKGWVLSLPAEARTCRSTHAVQSRLSVTCRTRENMAYSGELRPPHAPPPWGRLSGLMAPPYGQKGNCLAKQSPPRGSKAWGPGIAPLNAITFSLPNRFIPN